MDNFDPKRNLLRDFDTLSLNTPPKAHTRNDEESPYENNQLNRVFGKVDSETNSEIAEQENENNDDKNIENYLEEIEVEEIEKTKTNPFSQQHTAILNDFYNEIDFNSEWTHFSINPSKKAYYQLKKRMGKFNETYKFKLQSIELTTTQEKKQLIEIRNLISFLENFNENHLEKIDQFNQSLNALKSKCEFKKLGLIENQNSDDKNKRVFDLIQQRTQLITTHSVKKLKPVLDKLCISTIELAMLNPSLSNSNSLLDIEQLKAQLSQFKAQQKELMLNYLELQKKLQNIESTLSVNTNISRTTRLIKEMVIRLKTPLKGLQMEFNILAQKVSLLNCNEKICTNNILVFLFQQNHTRSKENDLKIKKLVAENKQLSARIKEIQHLAFAHAEKKNNIAGESGAINTIQTISPPQTIPFAPLSVKILSPLITYPDNQIPIISRVHSNSNNNYQRSWLIRKLFGELDIPACIKEQLDDSFDESKRKNRIASQAYEFNKINLPWIEKNLIEFLKQNISEDSLNELESTAKELHQIMEKNKNLPEGLKKYINNSMILINQLKIMIKPSSSENQLYCAHQLDQLHTLYIQSTKALLPKQQQEIRKQLTNFKESIKTPYSALNVSQENILYFFKKNSDEIKTSIALVEKTLKDIELFDNQRAILLKIGHFIKNNSPIEKSNNISELISQIEEYRKLKKKLESYCVMNPDLKKQLDEDEKKLPFEKMEQYLIKGLNIDKALKQLEQLGQELYQDQHGKYFAFLDPSQAILTKKKLEKYHSTHALLTLALKKRLELNQETAQVQKDKLEQIIRKFENDYNSLDAACKNLTHSIKYIDKIKEIIRNIQEEIDKSNTWWRRNTISQATSSTILSNPTYLKTNTWQKEINEIIKTSKASSGNDSVGSQQELKIIINEASEKLQQLKNLITEKMEEISTQEISSMQIDADLLINSLFVGLLTEPESTLVNIIKDNQRKIDNLNEKFEKYLKLTKDINFQNEDKSTPLTTETDNLKKALLLIHALTTQPHMTKIYNHYEAENKSIENKLSSICAIEELTQFQEQLINYRIRDKLLNNKLKDGLELLEKHPEFLNIEETTRIDKLKNFQRIKEVIIQNESLQQQLQGLNCEIKVYLDIFAIKKKLDEDIRYFYDNYNQLNNFKNHKPEKIKNDNQLEEIKNIVEGCLQRKAPLFLTMSNNFIKEYPNPSKIKTLLEKKLDEKNNRLTELIQIIRKKFPPYNRHQDLNILSKSIAQINEKNITASEANTISNFNTLCHFDQLLSKLTKEPAYENPMIEKARLMEKDYTIQTTVARLERKIKEITEANIELQKFKKEIPALDTEIPFLSSTIKKFEIAWNNNIFNNKHLSYRISNLIDEYQKMYDKNHTLYIEVNNLIEEKPNELIRRQIEARNIHMLNGEINKATKFNQQQLQKLLNIPIPNHKTGLEHLSKRIKECLDSPINPSFSELNTSSSEKVQKLIQDYTEISNQNELLKKELYEKLNIVLTAIEQIDIEHVNKKQPEKIMATPTPKKNIAVELIKTNPDLVEEISNTEIVDNDLENSHQIVQMEAAQDISISEELIENDFTTSLNTVLARFKQQVNLYPQYPQFNEIYVSLHKMISAFTSNQKPNIHHVNELKREYIETIITLLQNGNPELPSWIYSFLNLIATILSTAQTSRGSVNFFTSNLHHEEKKLNEQIQEIANILTSRIARVMSH